jgi:hypothetical protein
VIPQEDYRPRPGWYRHHAVLRWHTGDHWTDATRPLPDAGPARRLGSSSTYAVVVGIFALALAVIVIGMGRVIP